MAGVWLRRAAMAGCFALVTVTVTAAASDTAALENQTLRYAVFYGDIDAGTVEVRLRMEDGGYRIASAAKPSALANLFGAEALTSVTQFARASGGAWTLERGDEKLGGDATWFRLNRGRIEFSDGGHLAVAAGAHFEAAAFPLLLMLRLRAGEAIAGTRVIEVSARRAREYIYDAPVDARADSPAGETGAWKITRRRADRPADSVTVWLRKAGAPVPLKIAVTKRGRTSTLRLTAIAAEDES